MKLASPLFRDNSSSNNGRTTAAVCEFVLGDPCEAGDGGGGGGEGGGEGAEDVLAFTAPWATPPRAAFESSRLVGEVTSPPLVTSPPPPQQQQQRPLQENGPP